MSLLPKEERPKLKARRFNKFEPSSGFKKEEEYPKVTNNIPKQGYKRINNDEDNSFFKPKRPCTTSILNTSPVGVKNLANNRLKKLKEQLQAEESTNTPESKSVFHHNINESKRIALSNSCRKNIAEGRLNKIKQKLDAELNCQVINNPKSDLQKLDTQPQGSTFDKSVNETLHRSVNEENTFKLPIDRSNSFAHKMERTACWVENHRQHSDFLTNVESVNNRLPERNEGGEGTKTGIDDGSDAMEWTNAEPDDTVIDVSKSTNEAGKKDEDVKKIIKDPEKIRDICIVVDTNVFISALSKVRDIVNLKTSGLFNPIVYVPWMVITELDYMKDSCSNNNKLLKSVTNAIKFINAALESNDKRVVGQTVFDVEKQKHVGTSPDDKIISCCLQATEKYETVMLLSNDTNLKNKAMIHNVSTCSANEIMIKLMSKLGRNSKFQKVMHKMGIMCSSIICDCMKAAYGDVWLRMDLMNSPPWSLAECLKRFKKYWSAVFREKLLKHFTKALQDLQDVLQMSKYISDDSEEFVQFVKLCVTLCIFLKDIEECRGFVENTLADITKTA